LYEDRSVLAIDKPAGWMLIPFNWQNTDRNLLAAITSSIAARAFWAKSRNLKFLRNVHRLDAETTGILLFAKSLGAVRPYSDLFKSRRMEKTYLAIVHGTPPQAEWTCRERLGPDQQQTGRIRVDPKAGQDAETHFRVLDRRADSSLIAAFPTTGRTHQIRVHLSHSGYPVVGDPLYAGVANVAPIQPAVRTDFPMGLRAVALTYADPFQRRRINIRAPSSAFLNSYGFTESALPASSTARQRNLDRQQ
jgi:23S rRNA pseudouridine1911/1915/1917 synthase